MDQREREQQLEAEVESLKSLTLKKDAENERLRLENVALKAAAASSSAAVLQGEGGGGAPPLPPLPVLPRSHAAVAAALKTEERVVDSPTKTGAVPLQGDIACVDLSAAPLSPGLVALSSASSLQHWHNMTLAETLLEESAYPIATAFVPDWIVAQPRPAHLTKGCKAASTLFLNNDMPSPGFLNTRVEWICKPELLTAPKERFHAGFTGEIKSATSSAESKAKGGPKLFEELLTYGTLSMLGSYFQGVPRGHHRFFSSPPRAYALVGLAHVGYLVALEWAGKVLGSVVSEPFFLGSPAHEAAVARLPDSHLTPVDVCLDDIRVASWPEQADRAARVIWRTQPPPPPPPPLLPPSPAASSSAPPPPSTPTPLAEEHYQHQFFKLIPDHAFEAPFFRRLHAAYERLGVAWQQGKERGDPPPPALLPAQLLFSAGLVGVFMPWVGQGRSALRSELGAGGLALEPVVDALVWLARHGLLYTDLREPNVLVVVQQLQEGEGGEGGGGATATAAAASARVVLIDYDDMLCLDVPPANGEELCTLLQAEATALYARPEGSAGAQPAIMEALRLRVW